MAAASNNKDKDAASIVSGRSSARKANQGFFGKEKGAKPSRFNEEVESNRPSTAMAGDAMSQTHSGAKIKMSLR